MNQPERYESFILEPNEKKLKFQRDPKDMNAGTFTVLKEDHTLGNIVRMQLLNDPRVTFAGYKVPHPLLYELKFKVSTNGSATPVECMISSCDAICEAINGAKANFKRELRVYQMMDKKHRSGV